MSFSLPVFNLDARQWNVGHDHTVDVPDFNFVCQLYVNSRGMLDIEPGINAFWVPPIYIRAPKGTGFQVNAVIECVKATGFFYKTRWVERVHLGFDNEYIVALVEQAT